MAPGIVLDWVALNLLVCLTPRRKILAVRRYGSPGDAAFRVPPAELVRLSRSRDPATLQGRIMETRRTLRRAAEEEFRRCERNGIRLLPLDDRDYPPTLREIADPPVLLYALGRTGGGSTRVALVGSRRATAYGLRTATSLAAGLAERGIEVVSGGARGIDSEAHHGALNAGGSTIAVIGSGLNRPYPTENHSLFRKISENGAIYSEFPLDFPPKPQNFPMRNRIISGISAAVVVIEAASRSGSLITARHALDQNREVMAVPGPVSSVLSEGCNRLIREGASLVRGSKDVIEDLPHVYLRAVGPERPERQGRLPFDPGRLTPDERAVAALLDPVEPVHLDDLAERAPMGIARLQAALFGLEVHGVVEQSPGRYYLLRPREVS